MLVLSVSTEHSLVTGHAGYARSLLPSPLTDTPHHVHHVSFVVEVIAARIDVYPTQVLT